MKRTLIYVSGLLIISIALFAYKNVYDWKLINKVDTIRELGQGNIVVRDGLAYYISGKTLLILDVSDPSNVNKIGISSYEAELQDIALYKDFAILSSSDMGLLIVNIHSPEEPELVGKYPETGNARYFDILIQDDFAYVADYTAKSSYDNKTIILDLTDPLQVKRVSYIASGGRPLAFYDNYLYTKGAPFRAQSSVDWLNIVDISDKNKPKIVFHSDSLGDVLDAKVQDHCLYIATSNRVVIADLSNPANPVQVGRINVVARQIFVQSDFFYYMGFERVGIMNIADISSPKAIATSRRVRYATNITYSNGYVYFVGGTGWPLYIFEGGER